MAALLLLAPLTEACASGGAGALGREPAATDRSVVVRVSNNLARPASAWVTARWLGRATPAILGTVHPSETLSFEVDTRTAPSLVLVSRNSDRSFVVSRRIDVVSFATIEWNLRENIVTIDRKRTGP